MNTKIKVLFLSAAPDDWDQTHGDREIRNINAEIIAALAQADLELVSSPGVRVDDLQRELLRHRPSLVHFSGHGERSGGIMLENAQGHKAAVNGEALASLFEVLRGTIRGVFLNACESQQTAEAFQQLVDFTIAMRRPISDDDAVCFSTAFYRGLAHRLSVRDSFALGISDLKIHSLDEIDIPVLFERAAGVTLLPTGSVNRSRATGRVRSVVSVVNSTTRDIIVIDGDSNVFMK